MSNPAFQQTIESVWESGKRYDFTEVDQLVRAELTGFEGRNSPYDRGNQNVAKMMMMLGEAGIGKTSFWKELAVKYKIPLRIINFGEVEVEDNLGIPKAQEGSDYHAVQAPPGFPLHTPEADVSSEYDVLPGRDISASDFKGKGIVLFNEVCTVNPKQESQLRSAISERKIGYNRIADGWILVADSNPSDTKYTTVNKLDYSLEARIFALPVNVSFRDSMSFWRRTQILGDRLYGFLRMKGETTWQYADNRRWTSVADTVQCLLAAKAAPTAVGKFLGITIDPAVGTEFEAYMRFGDDPVHYPIPVRQLLSCTKEEHASHMKLADIWKKDPDKQALLGATAQDLREHLHEQHKPMDDTGAMKNINDFFKKLHSNQVAEIISDSAPELSVQLRDMVRGTDHDRKILDMVRKDAQNRVN